MIYAVAHRFEGRYAPACPSIFANTSAVAISSIRVCVCPVAILDFSILPIRLLFLWKMSRTVTVDVAIEPLCLVALNVQALGLERVALREVGSLAAAALVCCNVLDAHADQCCCVYGLARSLVVIKGKRINEILTVDICAVVEVLRPG
jgi:hypothetical protein